ncbi:DUF2846 domain-containing protein [Noviherbaspirillum sp. CPCC 100848]|uniref:DUF2846 domain-containing protein n=1 Tax=Noviherbaspirillum album TaxID=3080276 RepID=A0ABU6J493_9BURK|nr:DUF2846 domain-containing protein [Noviherbaspirillum sp. CPCC 100848]MEC4718430.1 DUF2846 domain-containing protein [Noviherbaspirillum sp. CPCC 100848]
MKSISLVIVSAVLAACTSAPMKEGFAPCNQQGRTRQCVTVPLALAEEDVAAKRFEALPDKVRIYLVRPFTVEPIKRSQVFVDQQLVAEMAPLTYVVIDVDPGLHHIGVRTDVDAAISLRTDAGKLYYVQYSLSQLFGNYSGQLKTMDEAPGRSALLKSKRALTRIDSPM